MVKHIRVLALDIDGVLTDGTGGVTESGHEEKRFSFQDLDAVTRARDCGLQVVLVTGENTPAVSRIARRFGVERVLQGAKDKMSALAALSNQLDVPLSEFCYVGDGDRDAPALAEVGLGLAPANATPAAKASAHCILYRPGGAGAVAEAVDLLCRLQADTDRAAAVEKELRRIVNDNLITHQQMLNESLPVLVQVTQTFVRAIRTGHKILLFGNGGSAADAQHVAAELIGRFLRESEPWPAIALTTDTSILTAVGNDWEFADIFARQVRALARPGDVVVGISTSGRSPNVLRGLETGKTLGAITIGFTGRHGGEMGKYSDICFRAPADATPRIQELHLLAWHAVCELVENSLASTV
ncbi:MAG: SIS domain-containing protein [Acidobacteria bacterium]|nr:SIS domain-containing protein [Acidobacteriota bacterium]